MAGRVRVDGAARRASRAPPVRDEARGRGAARARSTWAAARSSSRARSTRFGVDPRGPRGGGRRRLHRRLHGDAARRAAPCASTRWTWAAASSTSACARDPRVVVRERVNARDLSARDVPEPCGIATMDVSFISVAQDAAGRCARCWPPDADAVVLVKPQFEVGPRPGRPRRDREGPGAAPAGPARRWRARRSASRATPCAAACAVAHHGQRKATASSSCTCARAAPALADATRSKR